MPVWPLKMVSLTPFVERNPSCPNGHVNVRVVAIGAAKGIDGKATIGASVVAFVPFETTVFAEA